MSFGVSYWQGTIIIPEEYEKKSHWSSTDITKLRLSIFSQYFVTLHKVSVYRYNEGLTLLLIRLKYTVFNIFGITLSSDTYVSK